MRSPPEIWGAFFMLTGHFICDYMGLCQLQEKTMDKEIQEKVIATAREFKDQGECDIWHTIWYDGVPYDMHLMLDQSLDDKKWEYEVLVYPVKQDENGEWTRGVVNDPEHCDILLFKHIFPDRGEWR